MAQPAETFDEVIAAVAPLLAERGYRKSARNFVAVGGGVARVIQFQSNQLKKPAEASFTFNVLVSSVAFHEAYTGKPFPRAAGSAEPVVQAGIGRLTDEGEPIWWGLAPGVSAKLIIGEVTQLLEQKALPFLARFPDEGALLAALEKGDDLPGFSAMRERCRAVLLAKAGRKDESRRALAALIEANSTPDLAGFRASVSQLASRLGVGLESSSSGKHP